MTLSTPHPPGVLPKAVIFDLDGTLVDTEPAAMHAIEDCLSTWGIESKPEDARYITGRTWESAIAYLSGIYSLPYGPEDTLVAFLTEYRKRLQTDLIEVKGASAFVAALPPELPVVVVSGSHRKDIAWVLGRLGISDRIQWYLGAEDYLRSKPAPDGYLSALNRLGLDPSDAIVFEDSEAGIHSAVQAKIPVIVVTSTGHYGHCLDLAQGRIHDFHDFGVDPLGHLARIYADAVQKRR